MIAINSLTAATNWLSRDNDVKIFDRVSAAEVPVCVHLLCCHSLSHIHMQTVLPLPLPPTSSSVVIYNTYECGAAEGGNELEMQNSPESAHCRWRSTVIRLDSASIGQRILIKETLSELCVLSLCVYVCIHALTFQSAFCIFYSQNFYL